ncbi:hypothetical protein ACLGI4_01865 [Streptomyces sp. HMX112]|uniref:hypothetical protein n=1 Tax=Streptomyces sp. HMX112 TaxID=3390850 RepID=UPI003A80938D
MNKRALMPRAAVVLATLGAVVAGPAAQVHAAVPDLPGSAAAARAAGEVFPELNGVRIRAANSSDVYLVLDGRRHLIPSSVTYNALFSGTDGVRTVLTTENIADGGPLTAYAHLARSTTDPTVHLVSHGYKREITPAAMDKFGFDRQKVRTTYPEVLAGLPSAAPLT